MFTINYLLDSDINLEDIAPIVIPENLEDKASVAVFRAQVVSLRISSVPVF